MNHHGFAGPHFIDESDWREWLGKLVRAVLDFYRNEPFVHVAKKGVLPQTQNVRGSNYVQIGVFADRIKNRAIVISVLDNLVKGSAGQAIQNMNLMFGLPETAGLEQIALFP